MSFIMNLLGTAGNKILLILGLIAGLAGVYFKGKQSGKSEEALKASKEREELTVKIAKQEIKAAKQSAAVEVETMEKVNNVQASTSPIDSNGVTDRLREKWTRD